MPIARRRSRPARSPLGRVVAPEARLSANFARLGFHHGFGLSVTLPALVERLRGGAGEAGSVDGGEG